MKPGDPLDLDALARQADSTSDEGVVVQRSWLARVHKELMDGRVAQAQLDLIFGGREPAPCTAAASAR